MLSPHIPLFHPLYLHKLSYHFANMPGLVDAMAILTDVFNKYSGKEGDSSTLTKGELAELLRKELSLPAQKKGEVDEFFKALDNDGDGLVDFTEYVTFVAALTAICKK